MPQAVKMQLMGSQQIECGAIVLRGAVITIQLSHFINQRAPALDGNTTPNFAAPATHPVTIYVLIDGLLDPAANPEEFGGVEISVGKVLVGGRNASVAAAARTQEFGGVEISVGKVLAGGRNASVAGCGAHANDVAALAPGRVSGSAPASTRIRHVRVLNCLGGTDCATAAAGLHWILSDYTASKSSAAASGHPFFPAIASLSVVSPTPCQELEPAVAALASAGVLSVVAAGNSARNACELSPGSAPGALAVGAVDRSNRVWRKSNFGRCVGLDAPGVGVG
eukprot:CAMPEP_0174913364 /NCGR_PEP_ID=MMETSP0167-20121228/80281_1 /TAXON_ID=38298 /ORGANISM="Rhodella maculata, Strain CCMP736" /LENGTH=280 /DNA_ID=CAMNT_0016158079 /DNA_START=163 /DNA_END=1003 /DNA_ORIENTATION=+